MLSPAFGLASPCSAEVRVDSGDLAGLVADLRSAGADSHSVEVKAAVGKLPKTVPETLSAFSNGAGGTLILGLDERSGFRPAAGFAAVSIRMRSRGCVRTTSFRRSGP